MVGVSRSPRLLLLTSYRKHVTRHLVVGATAQQRLLAATARLGERAARMKAASGRRSDRARHLAAQHDALTPGGGIDLGHGREQRARVRMARVRIQLAAFG